MTFSIWLSLLMICMLGAMSPGPSLAVVAKHSLAGGRLHGIVTSWAHAFGVGVYALLTLLGLAVVLKQSPALFQVMTYSGAAYLAYLGINALRSKGGVAAKLAAGESASMASAARDGLMISVLNPKLALFFLALFSQFVAVGSAMSDKVIIVATPLLVDGLWYTLIALVLSRPAVLETLKTRAQLIDRLSGVVLIMLALRVVWQG
ncbi:LysE family transporter [Photobacterium sp. WH77]|uniref:LysE family transporter n=1 Tax=Photobacterium arenosum TaxID=2774143 RepID=A0ABR9BHP9_9GAMM|nr:MULTISPECIES: LysE family transporter [Photobacterium]MBD8511748.1 LysE family transporter [Photobacterium arenosum]MBV7261548.1 LysE family transporter [Photobacterium sp. WH24]MCG2836822.1 LysE family transporter [Photobacterium sp. WH77]MCG2844569.1 LysE family transporter [Photobacterium sp. WH80]MDO6583763.1 LysE family transporter [Photobacterium sp. 2_MG-2023]